MTTAITGKSCTFEYGGSTSGTAQITTATIDESASSETIQTLGGSVAISQGIESTVSCDFLYDGDVCRLVLRQPQGSHRLRLHRHPHHRRRSRCHHRSRRGRARRLSPPCPPRCLPTVRSPVPPSSPSAAASRSRREPDVRPYN